MLRAGNARLTPTPSRLRDIRRFDFRSDLLMFVCACESRFFGA